MDDEPGGLRWTARQSPEPPPYKPRPADFERFRDFLYGAAPSGTSLLAALGAGLAGPAAAGGEVNPQSGEAEAEADPLADFLFVRRTREAKQAALVAHVSNVAYSATHEMVMVILPRINAALGGDVLTFANLRALANTLQLCGGVLVGAMADRTGPKTSLLLSHASAAVSFFLLGFASSVRGLYLSALPLITMHGFQSTMHVIIQHSEDSERSRALSRVGALYGMGFFGGSAILIGALRFFPERRIAFMASGLEATMVAMIATSLPDVEQQVREAEDAKSTLENFLQVLRRPGVAPILTFKLGVTIAAGAVLNMTQQFAADPFGLSSGSAALLMSYLGGLHIVAQSLVSDSIRPRALYSVSTLAVGGSLLGMAATPVSPSAFVMWLAPLTLSFHAANVMLGSLLTLYVPQEEMGSVLGLSIASMTLGQIVTVPVAARLYHHYSFTAVPLTAGLYVIAMAAGIFLVGYLPPELEVEERGEDAAVS